MVRALGPLFSISASKQLAKSIIFKTKGGKTFVTRYNKPGGKNPFTPSASQTGKRDDYYMATGIWQNFSDAEKAYWDNLAESSGKNISGWNYFLGEVMKDPDNFCSLGVYGLSIYGYKEYGREEKRNT